MSNLKKLDERIEELGSCSGGYVLRDVKKVAIKLRGGTALDRGNARLALRVLAEALCGEWQARGVVPELFEDPV